MRKYVILSVFVCLLWVTGVSADMNRLTWNSPAAGGGLASLRDFHTSNLPGMTIDPPADVEDVIAESWYPDAGRGGQANNYTASIHGWVTIPESGSYTWHLHADDHAILMVSTNSDMANLEEVASIDGWSSVAQWDKYPTQTSASIHYAAGQTVAVFAAHREGGGGDNLGIAWTRPGTGAITYITEHVTNIAPLPTIAKEPGPEVEADDVWRDTSLTWSPGAFAATHNVYFGATFGGVNDGVAGTWVADGSTETSFDPGRLAFGETYYWRVDEVNGAPDYSVFKGEIWSFTVEPVSKPITNVTATGASSPGVSVLENTLNGSGMTGDLHGTVAGDMWISASIPATVEYAFDRVYKMHELWIWNSNQVIEGFVGFGAKDVVIEISLDGANWTVLEGVGPLAQAPGTPGYAHNNTIDFDGAVAQHVRLTINTVHGFAPAASLSELRFYAIPTLASGPDPADGATDVAPDKALSWARNGRDADHHDVYLGTDASDLALAEGVDLQLSQTYAWRVDAVNDLLDPSTWASAVWSFTTTDSIAVDDMEGYRDEEFFEIWATWLDGFDDPANGSLVGNGATGSPENEIAYGSQSLPFYYDNATAPMSEVKRTFETPQAWTGHGVTHLGINFQGAPANGAAQLYVKVNGVKVLYDGDASDVAQPWWQYWGVDLASLGIDLTRVTTLSIGLDSIGGVGTTGRVLFDNLGLYGGGPATPVGTRQVFQDWDALAVGSNPHDLDGWEGWFGDRTQGGAVTNVVASSGTNALELVGGRDDVVPTWPDIDSGVYVLTTMQSVPSATNTGLMFFRVLTDYNPANTAIGSIISDCAGGTVYVTELPAATRPSTDVLRDEWTKLTVVLDFNTNTSTYYYNDVYLGARDCPSVMGVNIYPNGAIDRVYFDDFRLEPAP